MLWITTSLDLILQPTQPDQRDGNAFHGLREESEAGRIKNTNKELMYFAQLTGLSLAVGQLDRKLL